MPLSPHSSPSRLPFPCPPLRHPPSHPSTLPLLLLCASNYWLNRLAEEGSASTVTQWKVAPPLGSASSPHDSVTSLSHVGGALASHVNVSFTRANGQEEDGDDFDLLDFDDDASSNIDALLDEAEEQHQLNAALEFSACDADAHHALEDEEQRMVALATKNSLSGTCATTAAHLHKERELHYTF